MAEAGKVPNELPPNKGGNRTIDGAGRKGLTQEKGQLKTDKGLRTA